MLRRSQNFYGAINLQSGKSKLVTFPTPDQLAFAVTKQTAVQLLREVRERRLPLRVSLNIALDSEIRVLPMDKSILAQLEALGFRRTVLPKADYPKLDSDMPTWILAASRSTPTRTCPTRS